jgi:hypothetical protein
VEKRTSIQVLLATPVSAIAETPALGVAAPAASR